MSIHHSNKGFADGYDRGFKLMQESKKLSPTLREKIKMLMSRSYSSSYGQAMSIAADDYMQELRTQKRMEQLKNMRENEQKREQTRDRHLKR